MIYTDNELRGVDLDNDLDAVKFCRGGECYQFSNFWKGSEAITDGCFVYPTVEHYYQAQKTEDIMIRMGIAAVDSPFAVKKLSHKLILRPDWSVVKYNVMREGLRQKFLDPKLRTLLLSTKGRKIIEWTSWGDKVWGMCDKVGNGANALGKLLMELRYNINTSLEPRDGAYVD